MTLDAAHYSVGDTVRVSSDAPPEYNGRIGVVTEIGPSAGEYRIEFEDGERPTTGYFPTAWLSRAPSSLSS